jgi:hypothetical protein
LAAAFWKMAARVTVDTASLARARVANEAGGDANARRAARGTARRACVLRADDASVVAGRARTRVADTDIIASRGIGGTRGRLLGRRGGDAKRTTRVSERHGDIESDDSAAGSGLRATRGTLSPSVVARWRILRKSRER